MKRLYGIFVILLFGIDFIFGQSVKSDSLFHVGMEQYNEHKYELAIKTFNYVKELDILENGNEFYRNFYADWWISSSYLQMGDSAKAESVSDYYDTYPINRALTRVSDSLAYVGVQFFDAGNYSKALVYFSKALSIDLEICNNTSYLLNSINNVLNCYLNLNDSLSEPFIVSLIDRGKLICNSLYRSKINITTKYDFYYLAACHYSIMKQPTSSRKLISQFKKDHDCFDFYKGTKQYEELLILGYIIDSNYSLEDLSYIDEVIDLQSTLYGDNSPNLLTFLGYKISCCNILRQYSKSLEAADLSLKIIQQQNLLDSQNRDYLDKLCIISSVYKQRDLFDKAQYTMDLYINSIKEISAEIQIRPFNFVLYADILKEQEEYSRALSYYNLCVDVIKEKYGIPEYAKVLISMLKCYLQIKDLRNATELFEKLSLSSDSLAVSSPETYVFYLGSYIDVIEDLKNTDDIKTYYQKFCVDYDKLDQSKIPSILKNIISNTKIIFGQMLSGDYDAFIKIKTLFSSYFQSGLNDLNYSLLQQQRSVKELDVLIETLSTLLCGQNNDQPSINKSLYDFHLLSYGYLLNSERRLRSFITNSKDSLLIGLYHRYLDTLDMYNICKETNSLQADSLSMSVEILQAELIEICNERGFINFDINLSWTDIQNKLKPKDIVIDFLPCSHPDLGAIYFALTITKNDHFPHFHYVCSQEEISKICNNSNIDFLELYDLVWRPLQPLLNKSENIFFTPCGDLHKLPIESFSDNDSKRFYRLSSSRELVKEKKNRMVKKAALYGGLNYSADLNVLIENSKQYPILDDNRVNRDYRYLRESYNSIPFLNGSQKEVDAIYDIFTHSDNDIETNKFCYEEGTESSFKALSGQGIDLIHIGTHGFYYNLENAIDTERASMTSSGLLFAGAENTLNGTMPNEIEDGILNALEISTLDFSNLDIITLSACQSGLGVITNDGVFGLQRGFKQAGAGAILMSLWNVDDEATQILMTEFYSNWIDKKMTKHDALENAKECVRTNKTHPQWSDPKYWAAFILLDGLN